MWTGPRASGFPLLWPSSQPSSLSSSSYLFFGRWRPPCVGFLQIFYVDKLRPFNCPFPKVEETQEPHSRVDTGALTSSVFFPSEMSTPALRERNFPLSESSPSALHSFKQTGDVDAHSVRKQPLFSLFRPEISTPARSP